MQFKALLENYFHASNHHDLAAMVEYFAVDAIAKDEGKEHDGIAQIRQWLKETNAAYNPHYVIQTLSTDGDKAKAVVTTSGTFPGSPIQLTFNFVFANNKITSLTFGA